MKARTLKRFLHYHPFLSKKSRGGHQNEFVCDLYASVQHKQAPGNDHNCYLEFFLILRTNAVKI